MRIRMTSGWRVVAACLLGAMLLMIVGAVNGYPIFFNDTRSYVRQPALIIKAVAKRDLVAAWPNPSEEGQSKAAGGTQTKTDDKMKNNGITANRSVYYGFLALLGFLTGGFWLTAIIQSTWVSVLLYMLVSLTTLRVWPTYILCMANLAVFSCAGFFTAYIMPDIFAPIMIVAACLLLLFFKNLTRGQLIFIVVSIVFALLAHLSHQVILVVLTAMFLVWAWLAHVDDLHLLKPVCLIIGCIAIGVLGQFAFDKGVERYSGEKPLLLPHIEAHLIDMGPGSDYAKHACDPQRFVVCQYKDMFPMYWETFIGSTDPHNGVFAAVDLDTKRKLSGEQIQFALAVAEYDPVGVSVGLLRDAAAQLVRFSLKDLIVDQPAMNNYNSRFPPDVARHIAHSAVRQWAGTVTRLSIFYEAIVALALVCLACFSLAYRRPDQGVPFGRENVRVAAFIVSGVVVNGLVCGLLASPYDRFQARVIWLLVFTATLIGANLIRNRACRKVVTRSGAAA